MRFRISLHTTGRNNRSLILCGPITMTHELSKSGCTCRVALLRPSISFLFPSYCLREIKCPMSPMITRSQDEDDTHDGLTNSKMDTQIQHENEPSHGQIDTRWTHDKENVQIRIWSQKHWAMACYAILYHRMTTCWVFPSCQRISRRPCECSFWCWIRVSILPFTSSPRIQAVCGLWDSDGSIIMDPSTYQSPYTAWILGLLHKAMLRVYYTIVSS